MNLKMSLEEMISKLDTACGMLLVPAMKSIEAKKAMEMVTEVSLALGEVETITFSDYSDFDAESEEPK